MSPQLISQPPLHLRIPKYLPEYSSSRTKLPQSCLDAALHIASTRDSLVALDANPLPSPLAGSFQYHYVSRAYDPPSSSTNMYQASPPSHSYSTSFQPAPHTGHHYDAFPPAEPPPPSRHMRHYPSESPSPVDVHPAVYAKPIPVSSNVVVPSPSYSRDHLHINQHAIANSERPTRNSVLDRSTAYAAGHSHVAPVDHRRMSEPAILGPVNSYASPSAPEGEPSHRIQSYHLETSPTSTSGHSRLSASASAYTPSLQRGTSMSSLRDLRHSQLTYPAPSAYRPSWRDGDPTRSYETYRVDGFDDQLSPLQPNFGGEISSPMASSRYLASNDHYYGPSPPGTGTSASSTPVVSPNIASTFIPGTPRDLRNKTYSFVPLPGNNVKKRPRRRYDEIERLYQCSWPDCSKSYGTLNHLNAHVTMQKHGPKRHPSEFKELRKRWRKAKKEAELSTASLVHRRGNLSAHIDERDRRRQFDPNDIPGSPYVRTSNSIPIYDNIPNEGYSVTQPSGRSTVSNIEQQRAMHSTPARQRYGPTPSWHGSSRSSQQGHPSSSSLPSQLLAHENNVSLPHLDTVLSNYPSVSYHQSASVPINRLPPDSTLLTPLPGYQPPTMPPLHYEVEGYDGYEKNLEGPRPDSGYATERGSGIQ